MSSDRRTVHGEVPDGVADRSEGYTHNPNPEDELAAQRAHFAERQQQLQHDREEAAHLIEETQQHVAEQYKAAQQNPDHQAFAAEQQEEQSALEPSTHGGQFDRSGALMPDIIGAGEMERRVPTPVEPSPDELPGNKRSER